MTTQPKPLVPEATIVGRDWHRHQSPRYRVDECAKLFFAMSASWLRGKLSPDPDHPQTWFTHADGSRMDFRRSDPGRSDSARVFLLSDVEPMVESLLKNGAIDEEDAALTMGVVRATALLYKLLPDEEADDPE